MSRASENPSSYESPPDSETPLPPDAHPNSSDTVNFYGKQLPKAKLEPFFKFYDADHKLTPQERQLMASDLDSIRSTLILWGFFDGSLAFFAPTFYRNFLELKKSGQLPGVKPIRRFVHRPMLSTAIGSVAYFVSIYFHAQRSISFYTLRLQSQVLAGENTESNQRRLDVWKTFTPSQVTFYYLYYRKLSQDLGFVLPDPRNTKPHDVYYRPPEHEKHHETKPHWDEIRRQNGFEGRDHDDTASGSVGGNASAWDKIRRGRKD